MSSALADSTALPVTPQAAKSAEPASPASTAVGGSPDPRAAAQRGCTCGFASHAAAYDAAVPIMTGPDVAAGSYAEALAAAKAMCGYWVTLLERSDSMDAQFRHLGLSNLKRSVMNRRAIPLRLHLEREDKALHQHILTPIGTRHMVCDLTGAPFVDEDPDVGRWEGTAAMVDFSIPWFCNGKAVRALQQVRTNAKAGWSVETRCVLPDAAEGEIMFFNITLYTPEEPPLRRMSADRILRRQLDP